MPTAVALIPARSGSKRVSGKNIRPLAGHPVLAYTIAAARSSGVFTDVVLSTDSADYATIGRHYGAEVPCLRPPELAGDTSPDIDWVDHMLRHLAQVGRNYDAFSILRPTSPFRLPATIRRAWDQFCASPDADSLRAVEPCKQHPGKMWILRGARMEPLLTPEFRRERFGSDEANPPWHSRQYQALPPVYVQNASLEIAWTRVALEGRSIAGDRVIPFLTTGHEGFDVNHPFDWDYAEAMVKNKDAVLPVVDSAPWQGVQVTKVGNV